MIDFADPIRFYNEMIVVQNLANFDHTKSVLDGLLELLYQKSATNLVTSTHKNEKVKKLILKMLHNEFSKYNVNRGDD